MTKKASTQIPIIDLFAGPGGLSEGFSQCLRGRKRAFKVNLSIEMDKYAHETLLLRAFFRQFDPGNAPELYYRSLQEKCGKGDPLSQFRAEYPIEVEAAEEEAQCETLGDEETAEKVNSLIAERSNFDKFKKWILIGGPPCQAYSLAGRSRMLGLPQKTDETESAYEKRLVQRRAEFEKDHRHFLYREYLKIIADRWPPVFVMENVKGILSASFGGEKLFPGILNDLKNPNPALKRKGKGHQYEIRSFVVSMPADGGEPDPTDYLIRSEEYGVPQTRHRVILLGVRDDLTGIPSNILKFCSGPTVDQVIKNLPKIAPSIAPKHESSLDETLKLIRQQSWKRELKRTPKRKEILEELKKHSNKIWNTRKSGGFFTKEKKSFCESFRLKGWLDDERLKGVCNHENRGHMPEDLRRYYFCSCFGKVMKKSPKLSDFPECLLPKHENVKADQSKGDQKFADRFRVQIGSEPSKTIVSHISADGHYFIHPEPAQARSLTVREAARLQTFPDNYFFEGPRTQQYKQVGNAVPPYLAHQIAEIVKDLLDKWSPIK